MWRALVVVAVIGLSTSLQAQEATEGKKPASEAVKSTVEQLRDNPDDAKAFSAYINEMMSSVVRTMAGDPQEATKKLDEMEAVVGELKPATSTGKNLVMQAKSIATSYRKRIELQASSLADLEKKLQADPSDRTALNNYLQKATMEISQLVRSNPEEAGTKLEVVKAFLASLTGAATDDVAKTGLRGADQVLANLERGIEAGKKLTKMIGKDAASLKVEAWVNGSPLTDADLKGKVVFLDFWAVWCGPCIATFPHLKEWNEKYADKGLVIIGLTNYYNFTWDDEEKKATRATEKVTPAEEQEMLVKFAQSHELKHRFAIEADRSLSEYYGVTGIPHVVVIDREGKVRMMKVGSGEANAKEIGDLLAQLLETKAAGGQ
jgi:thiol-disulfide isomerase/thioredoxin